MNEICQRCNDEGEDRRTLWMACFYEMNELRIPFHEKYLKEVGTDDAKKLYTLRVCKDCRADWMSAIQQWFKTKNPEKISCGSGIYIRKNGATIEITEQEWNERYPGKTPVRFMG